MLEDRVKELKSEINAELLDALDVGDSKSAVLDDGTSLGRASRVAGALRAVVTNETVLRAWVKENHPSELVEQVRESYLAVLLDSAKKHGEAVDMSTGAIVPGIEVRRGLDSIWFRPSENMERIVLDRWRELTDRVLALPGGES